MREEKQRETQSQRQTQRQRQREEGRKKGEGRGKVEFHERSVQSVCELVPRLSLPIFAIGYFKILNCF